MSNVEVIKGKERRNRECKRIHVFWLKKLKKYSKDERYFRCVIRKTKGTYRILPFLRLIINHIPTNKIANLQQPQAFNT